MVFARLLRNLVRDPTMGPLVAPIVSDEARTFGLESIIAEAKIYAPEGQQYVPVDADLPLHYAESTSGQVLQEGITEAGAMASFTALATAYATWGQPMLPVFLFYSMFGFQRVGDLTWALGDIRGRGILAGCTAGRTTLQGEGLQHDDGHSPLLASVNPAAMIYDASFAYEVAVIMQDAITRILGPDPEDRFWYLTLYNETYPMPPLPEGPEGERIRQGIVNGIYQFSAGPDLDADLDADTDADLDGGTGAHADSDSGTWVAATTGSHAGTWAGTDTGAGTEPGTDFGPHGGTETEENYGGAQTGAAYGVTESGTEPGGTESGGTESGGTESGGTEHGGTEHGGTEHDGAETGEAETGTGLRASLCFSGPMWSVAHEAQEILAGRWGVSADTWAVTSWSRLRTDALEVERWNRLHPGEEPRRPLVTQVLGAGPHPVVAITDYMRAVPDQVSRFIERPYTSLGTDGFGRSDARDALREHFEVDAAHLVLAVLSELARGGQLPYATVDAAISELGLDPSGVAPFV
jgi:pyruvate dehydrogenase complex dehydrogenase (E1) component